MDTQINIVSRHGRWLVKLDAGNYLGPYSYQEAISASEVLAGAAWQLGYNSWVVLEDPTGARRIIWNHPKARHEAYA